MSSSPYFWSGTPITWTSSIVGVAVEVLLDLPRVHVLAAADDHVLDAPDDGDVAVGVHGGEVTGVHPPRGGRSTPRSARGRPSSRASPSSRGCTARPACREARSGCVTGSMICTSTWGMTVPTVETRRSRSSSRRVIVETGEVSVMPYMIVTSAMPISATTRLHDLDRAGRAGHDPGAQRRQVVVAEVGEAELGDEHGGHAVERRAALVLDGLQGGGGVERRRGDDDRGPVRRRPEVAHHHPEAVVEGHGHAHPVLLAVVEQAAHEEAVVQDVVVRQRRTLGEPGRARGVLDVDRVVEAQRRGTLGERTRVDRGRRDGGPTGRSPSSTTSCSAGHSARTSSIIAA